MLHALNRLTVRQKLSAILVAALGLGLLLAGIALVAFDIQRQARSVEADLIAQADTIGLASSGALSFNDIKGAAENLSVLRANPSVAAAALYTPGGERLATYGTDGPAAQLSRASRSPGTTFDREHVTVTRSVLVGSEHAGTIALRARHNLQGRALEHIGALFVIMALSLAAAVALASHLQRTVTEPLQELAGVAQRIRRGDFDLRAQRRNDDEVGEVVDAFNAMMDELAHRAQVLEAAKDALRGSNRAKDQFLATLAHELRNPLAPIRTGVEILRLRPEGPAAEKAISTIQRQLAHMVRLIDDLMDISRISTGKIRLDVRSVRLRAVLESAVELSRPAIEAGGHHLEVDAGDDIELEADPTRLAQCVGNLLNNAAKYTPRGGRIDLRARRQSATMAVIEVVDTGLGIPPAMLEQVFTMFTQVDKTLERSQGGLGIGLSLVRTLVELHGGTVTAASAGPDQGSTFSIRLPCKAPSASPQAESSQVARPAQPRTRNLEVLVVDDNVDAAQTLEAVLMLVGHEVRVAHSGSQALEKARSRKPDVVLLDIGLPGMSGYEVARAFRADPALADVRLVALTGWGAESDRQRSREAGFDAHLTKPVAAEDLLPVLGAGRAATAPLA